MTGQMSRKEAFSWIWRTQSKTYTSLVGLEITPQPDSLLRVFMAYRPMQEPIEVPPQRFETFRRSGFTAVEWGGVECAR